MSKLWNDDRGGIITTELVLVLSVMAAGVISGITAVRNSVVSEARDVARTVDSLNQSYGVSGVRSRSAHTAGASYIDQADIGIAFDGIIE